MDAKRCDQCGDFYQDLREPAAIVTVDVFKEDRARQAIKMHVSFLPMSPDGQGRDLCQGCRLMAISEVLRRVADDKFGLELEQKGAREGWGWAINERERRLAELGQHLKEKDEVIENYKKAMLAEQDHEKDLIKRISELDAALKAAQTEGKR